MPLGYRRKWWIETPEVMHTGAIFTHEQLAASPAHSTHLLRVAGSSTRVNVRLGPSRCQKLVCEVYKQSDALGHRQLLVWGNRQVLCCAQCCSVLLRVGTGK